MEPEEATETPTTASVWKKQSAAKIIDVPSGNKARVRRVSLDVVVKTGRLPNILMPMIQAGMQGRQPNATDLKPEMMPAFMELIDIICLDACEEPRLYPAPGEEGERLPDRLYVDEVDFADKMAVYEYAVGGAAALESFRDEQSGDVESVSDVEDVAVPS